MMAYKAAVAVLLTYLGKAVVFTDTLLPFSAHLDPQHLVKLCWGFDDVQGNITFELIINTTGWVSWGMSPNGDMMAADVVMGGVNADGHYFGDYYVNGYDMPTLDEEQDYNLHSLSESDGQTIMRFERSLKTCDEKDHPIVAGPLKMIYAYGPTDTIGYHYELRGTKELNLLAFTPRTITTDSLYFDLTVDKFTVPQDDTHYECRVMAAPSFVEKQHIYRIQPLIEHPEVVHHMLVYRCAQNVNVTFQEECYKSKVCFHVLAAWAIGGGDFEMPEQVGIPIGGAEGDFMYRLEIHYNNPTHTKGLVDSSGLRFHYTPKLRQHDASIMMTGLAVSRGYSIPPNATSFHTYGLCNTSVIAQVMPDSSPDLQVFAIGLHTHVAGRKLRVGHFRDDKQLGFLTVDENFNFDIQQTKTLGKLKTIKMGDSLLVECTYETKNRTDMTWSGLRTMEEMCLAFIYYYPALPISHCVSFPHLTALTTRQAPFKKELKKSAGMVWDEGAILEHERRLKELPQWLVLGDSEGAWIAGMGNISDMMETPTSSCRLSSTVAPNPSHSSAVVPNPSNMAKQTSCSLWLLLIVVLATL